MANSRRFTEEEKIELLSNPYTARVSDSRVYFTLAFKKFVLESLGKPGMTHRKIFIEAGYRDGIFSRYTIKAYVNRFRAEAASPEGLKEPRPAKSTKHRKKHTETEFKELTERVRLLEQQIEFLKKTQHIKANKRLIEVDYTD